MQSHNTIINDSIATVNLGQVMYSSYVKMTRLSEIVFNTYGNSSIATATQLNIFIDLNSVLHGLYSSKNRIVYDNITDISSYVINMCAHYRSFFRTLGVDTRIFLINSLNCADINKKLVANYNNEFITKVNVTNTKPMIDNNMALLKILCPYLPAIYYIDSSDNYEVAVIIADIIERFQSEHIPNLIISREIYPMQLCVLYPYTSYLFPLKDWINKCDNSWMLPINEKADFKVEFWNRFVVRRRIKNPDHMYKISPINIALFQALSGMLERDIKAIYTPLQAMKFIYSMVGSEDIKILPSQIMSNEEIVANYPVTDIISKYQAIDISYALPFYKASPECKQLQFLDLDDAPAVNKIAAKYYTNNPLDLQRL